MDSPIFQIVLPFLMSVIVILFFRKVDREKFHLSKIKRFTDSILSQFSVTVREKGKEVRSRVLELEEISNKSKLLADYLKEQIDYVNDRVKVLQSSDGILKRVEAKSKKIESLDSTIEKKLNELQKEGNIIDKLDEQINSLQSSVELVAKSVPEVETTVINESKNRMDNIKSQFESDLNLLSEQVEDKAKEALETFDEKISLLTEKQFDRINQTEEKIIEFDSSLLEAKKQIFAVKDGILENVNDRQNTIIKELENVGLEYNKRIDGFNERITGIEQEFKNKTEVYIFDINDKISSFSGLLENADTIAKDLENRFNKELDSKISSMSKSANSKVDFLKNNIQNIESQIADLMELPTNTINSSIDELSKRIDGEKKAFEYKIEDMNTKVVNLGLRLKDRFNKDIEQLVYSVEEEKRKIGKQTNNINLHLDSFIDTEKGRITQRLSEYFNNSFSDQKELAQNISILKKASDEMRKEIEDNKSTLNKDIEASNILLREKLTSSLEELGNKIEEQKKNSNRLYDSLQNSMENTESAIRDRVLSESKSISDMIEEKKAELTLFHENNKGIIQDKNREFDYMISSIKDFYNTELERIIQAIKANYAKVEQDYIYKNTRLLKNTEGQIRELGDEIDVIKDNFKLLVDSSTNGIEEQTQGYKQELTNFIDSLKKEIHEKEDKVMGRIEKKNSEINNAINMFEGHIHIIKDDTVREMTLFKSKSQNELEVLIGSLKERVANLNQELENKVALKTENIVVNIQNMVESLESEMNTRIKDYIEKTEIKVNNFDNEVKRIKNYDISIEEFNNKFDMEINRVGAELVGLKEKLSYEAKEEFKKVSDELIIIDERIEAFTKESRIFKKADKFYDKLREEIHYAGEQIKRIREAKEYFGDFDAKIDLLLQGKEQLKLAIARADNKKQSLMDITDKMETVISMKDDLDGKLSVIKKSMELVDSVKNNVAVIEDIYSKTKGKIEEISDTDAKIKGSLSLLTKSKDYIDGISKYIREVKKEFKDFYIKNNHFQNSVSEIEKRLSFIENAEDRTKEVMKRFNQMDSFVIDLEKRNSQIEIARERVADTEERLQTMHNVADEKIIELKELMSNNGGSANNPAPISGTSNNLPRGSSKNASDFGTTATSVLENSSNVATLHRSTLNNENRQEAVIKLYEKGFDINRISTLLNLSKSEVKLIIDVDKSKA